MRPRRPTLGAMLAVLAVSCARAPARDARRPSDGSERAAPPSAARRDDDTAASRHQAAPPRRRARTPDALEPGPTPEADQPPATPTAVRDAVSGAVSARGLPAYGTPRALLAIAGMLERVAGDDPAAAASTARMRRAIEALERLRGIDLDRADHVKEALGQGVAAIRAFARARGIDWLDAWVDAAAKAARAIDPASPLGLQRAAVQDALRSLADAVLVAEQFADRRREERARDRALAPRRADGYTELVSDGNHRG